MSETSRISVTDHVRRRVAGAMNHYRTLAAREKARKEFLNARPRVLGRFIKGKEPVDAPNRMYLQNERLLPEHGKEGENIHRRTKS